LPGTAGAEENKMTKALGNALAAAVIVVAAIGCGDGTGGGDGDAVQASDALDAGDLGTPGDVGEVGHPDVVPDVDAGPQFDLFLLDQEPTPDPLALYTIEPSKGKTVGADQVVLTGAGFQDGMAVIFGHQVANDVFVLSKKKATVITPAGFPGPTDVEVQTPDGQVTVLPAGFLYYNSVTIETIDPAVGPAGGGTPVMITGSGFTQGATAIVGDHIGVDIQVVDDKTILAVTPPGEAGYANVSVNAKEGFATLLDAFFYYEPPKVVGIVPSAGPAGGGSVVLVSMVGAHPETSVYFGDVEAETVSFVDWTKVEATVPPAPVGFVDVTVTTPFGTDTRKDGFFYFGSSLPPKDLMVLSVLPDSGPTTGGNTVQVSAFGLGPAEETTVLFGSKLAEVVSVSPGLFLLTVVAPPGEEGSADVTVMNGNGTSVLAAGYKYLPIAGVLDVTPDHGPAAGGTKVAISGHGFLPTAEVYFGALPAAGTEVLSPELIQAVTPVGSPGTVDVAVLQKGTSAVAADAFTYEGPLALYIVDPSAGSMAGGTYIKLIGAGFTGTPKVYVGGAPSSHVTLDGYNVITAKTPPGAPGTVDVEVVVGEETATLPLSFTYFDPLSFYGGTWGGQVYHAVNVTVLDGDVGVPLADAFVMLWANPDTPYQGFTDNNGQVTFSGPDLLGEQMVTASKECFSNSSVVEYDATNVTLYLHYNCPSMGSGFPPAFTPPIINGRVSGFGKYVVIPPGPCNYTGVQFPGLCQSCSTDADCPGADSVCANLGDQGKRCLTACIDDTECPPGFSCTSIQSGAEFGNCLPLGGKKMVFCSTSKGHYLGENPDNGPGMIADADGDFSLVYEGLGEIAIVCVGGVLPLCESEWDCIFGDSICKESGCWMGDGRPELTAYAMGVARHVTLKASGDVIEDVNILLDIPMNRQVNVFLDDPHLSWEGPNAIFGKVYVDFGSDGVFEFMEFPVKFYGFDDDTVLTFNHLPSNLAGNIADSTFAILGAAVTATGAGEDPQKLPKTFGLLTDLTEFEDDTIYVKGSGGWESQESGIKETLFDLWGDSWNNIYGVGLQGVVAHFNGYTWQPQPGGENEMTLRSVHGADGAVYAVGDQGTALKFNGAKWEAMPQPGGATLRGVWAGSQTSVIVVGDYCAYLWDGLKWTFMPGQVFHKFNSVFGVNSANVWAVGDYGFIIRLVNGIWVNEPSPVGYTLFDVWGTSPVDVWAVGDSGTIIHYDGTQWTVVESGTKATLKSVFGTGPQDVTIVGGKGTILHWDGTMLTDESLPGVQQDLLTGYASKDAGLAMVSGNHQVVMTPFVTPVNITYPLDNAVIDQQYLEWQVDPGPASSFYYTTLEQPSMMGPPIMYWDLMSDGDVTYVELPDFPNIEGTPGVPEGFYIYTVLRVYKEGFDIDNYDFMDLDYTTWKSWSTDTSNFLSE